MHLLGRPHLERPGAPAYAFRSRKSWALLAYLVLSERAPTRSQLATLLFSEADDPLRALRWCLVEIRRGLGEDGSVEGDPVVLRLAANTVVDARVVFSGTWADAVALPGLGAELLDGMTVRDATAFHTWLVAEQRHVAASTEAILHEAALRSRSRHALEPAIGYAVRTVAMNPLDENHQATLIRLYRLTGDDRAALRQYHACAEALDRELGTTPGPLIEDALRETRHRSEAPADAPSIEAVVEAGSAAVAAGAVRAGVDSLRTAVQLADRARLPALRVESRLILAEALVHSLRGRDEEGLAALYEVDEIALAQDLPDVAARARAELGYVDFLRARYDRAEVRLTAALRSTDSSPSVAAKAAAYLGSVASDRGNYDDASSLLQQGIELAREASDAHREAFALSMLGRVHLLRGELTVGTEELEASIELAERHQWLAFLPWPQGLRGDAQLRRSDPEGAAALLEQAFARACQVGDPCWEGMAARGLALVAEARGDVERAFALLEDARARCNRHTDPYVWLDGYILDAQCEVGLRHGHPDAELWVEKLTALASRGGMRELMVRALLHGAALGQEGQASAAELLAARIENPMIHGILGS